MVPDGIFNQAGGGREGKGPQVKIGSISHIFAFSTSKIISRDSRDKRTFMTYLQGQF